jgi:peptide/nickel transport system permease protein
VQPVGGVGGSGVAPPDVANDLLRRYVAKRLLVAIPSLIIASMIVFTLPRLIPGDVVQLMLEEKAYAKDIDELRAKLGLDRPIYIQYVEWMGRVVRGDLGESLWTRRPVVEELSRRVPVTLALGVLATIFAVVIALPVGVISAARQDTMKDYAARSIAVLGLSVPGFWLATLVIVLPAIWWGWRPATGFTELSASPSAWLLQFMLPAAILGIASSAAVMRLTRGMLLEVLRQDYVRTAWAKGLAERVVVMKHSLKNAVIPVLTVLGIQIAQIIGGTVIIESIFGFPGMGRFLFEAIVQRDYPVIQGVNLVVVSVIVLTNLVVDALYAMLDPRIRY